MPGRAGSGGRGRQPGAALQPGWPRVEALSGVAAPPPRPTRPWTLDVAPIRQTNSRGSDADSDREGPNGAGQPPVGSPLQGIEARAQELFVSAHRRAVVR